MFGIGGPELVVILVVLLLFVGPDKLPQVAKTVGTGLRDLRRAANLAQHELRQSMDELTREVETIGRDVTDMVEKQVQASDREEADRVARPPPTAPADGETLAVVPRRSPNVQADGSPVMAPPQAAAAAPVNEAPGLDAAVADVPIAAGPDASTATSTATPPLFNMPGLRPIDGTLVHGAWRPPAPTAASEVPATPASDAAAAASSDATDLERTTDA